MKKSNISRKLIILFLLAIVVSLISVLYSQVNIKEGATSMNSPQRDAMATKPLVELTKKYYAGTYPNGSACPDGYDYDPKADRCNLSESV
jgi:hypothetical protein